MGGFPQGGDAGAFQQQLNGIHNDVTNLVDRITHEQKQRDDYQLGQQRVGPVDAYTESNNQIKLMANVFYNMMNVIGKTQNNPEIKELAQ